MKITVCIGSSCHVRGSRYIIERLQERIAEAGIGEKITIGGTFCLGHCGEGVCVRVDDRFYSVTREHVNTFFETEILAKL